LVRRERLDGADARDEEERRELDQAAPADDGVDPSRRERCEDEQEDGQAVDLEPAGDREGEGGKHPPVVPRRSAATGTGPGVAATRPFTTCNRSVTLRGWTCSRSSPTTCAGTCSSRCAAAPSRPASSPARGPTCRAPR